jgi:hypothetical protein
LYYFFKYLLTLLLNGVIIAVLLFEKVTKGCWNFQQLNILNGE